MDTKKSKVILLSHFPEQVMSTLGEYQVLAALGTQSSDEQSPIMKLVSEQELRDFLSVNEVNQILVPENEKQLWLAYKESLSRTGLPVYQISSQGLEKFSSENQVSAVQLFLKRLIDILAAILGLLLVAVVTLVIYPIVQKQSPGPLFFKQKRVGKNGRRFHMYKFRSMYLDAEERKKDLMEQNEISSDLMFKLENDPRIFPFGQKIRDWSIDELPQFINVLKGDMSLIGTRPPTVEEVAKYELHHFKRLAMRPGITGMWQVSGRSNIQDFEEVVKLDASYIDNFSLWLDLKIILKTVKVVLKKEGSK